MPNDSAWPRITVVTPSFNQGEFLEETIRSVLLQGYPNLEYIVMDGGSRDGSLDILRRYEPWLSYWQSAPDNGQADAINQGFERATGSILAFLNSDDVFEPGTLRRVARDFLAAGGERLVHVYPVEDFGCCDPVVHLARQRHTAASWLSGKSYVHQPGAFWSRQAFDDAGGLDVSYRYLFDRKFFLALYARGYRFSYYSGPPVSRFRWHSDSKTFTERSMGFVAETDRLAREMGKVFARAGLIGRDELRDILAGRAQIAMSLARRFLLDDGTHTRARLRIFRRLLISHPEALLNRFFWGMVFDLFRRDNAAVTH
jgi:glycosyltransferase involved in cell wall biosynthesis